LKELSTRNPLIAASSNDIKSTDDGFPVTRPSIALNPLYLKMNELLHSKPSIELKVVGDRHQKQKRKLLFRDELCDIVRRNDKKKLEELGTNRCFMRKIIVEKFLVIFLRDSISYNRLEMVELLLTFLPESKRYSIITDGTYKMLLSMHGIESCDEKLVGLIISMNAKCLRQFWDLSQFANSKGLEKCLLSLMKLLFCEGSLYERYVDDSNSTKQIMKLKLLGLACHFPELNSVLKLYVKSEQFSVKRHYSDEKQLEMWTDRLKNGCMGGNREIVEILLKLIEDLGNKTVIALTRILIY